MCNMVMQCDVTKSWNKRQDYWRGISGAVLSVAERSFCWCGLFRWDWTEMHSTQTFVLHPNPHKHMHGQRQSFVRLDPKDIRHSTFLHSCVQGVATVFFPVPSSEATFIFQAKTSYRPRGPWCAQNKFNICHRIKWFCSSANEKPQTFENCLATLPARKKLSVTSFFRSISLSLSLTLSLSLSLSLSLYYHSTLPPPFLFLSTVTISQSCPSFYSQIL